jgi:hypothetical protein
MIQSPNFNPIPLFALFNIGRFDFVTFHWVHFALIVALVFCVLGLATRWSLLVSALLFFLIHGQLLSLTKSPDSPYVYHSENIVVFVLLILAFDSNINKFALFTTWRHFRDRAKNRLISSHSLNLVIIAMGFVYFGASYVRLVTNGLTWMDGFTLKSFFMMSHFSDGVELAYTLAKHHYMCMALSVGVIAFELSFLPVFFWKRTYLLLFAGSLIFHLSILMIMNINFFPYYGFAFVAYLFLPPISVTEDEQLLDYGFSKARRSDLKQIVVGILMSKDGIPLAHEAFSGNTNDVKCFSQIIDQLKNKYNVSNIALVGDRGMISKSNVGEIEDSGLKYILGYRMRTISKDERKVVLRKANLRKLKNLELQFKEVEYRGQRLIVCYNAERAEKDKEHRESEITKLKEKLKNSSSIKQRT